MPNISIKYPERVKVIGVPISTVTLESSLNFVADNMELLRGEYICASNVYTTVLARENKEYLIVQSESALSLPDGKPLSVIGQKATSDRIDKVTGTHFMQAIFSDERFRKAKHYFYGTTKQTLDRMIPKIRDNYPDLQICGWQPSIFRELDDDELDALANEINASEADFVWVGIGAPRQELLMYHLKGKTNAIMTGVGGAFNILAGLVNDAPIWMQNLGLEWVYRLYKEPKRLLKRYVLTNAKFILYNLKLVK